MTHWRKTLAFPAAVCLWLMGLLGLAACGPEPAAPAPPAQVQIAPPDPIPAPAREALGYIRQHGYAPPGFVGGRVFGNYEGALPRYDARRKRIDYREWDIHPRAEGRARGAERLITGSDGRVWFTADHYRTFVEVK